MFWFHIFHVLYKVVAVSVTTDFEIIATIENTFHSHSSYIFVVCSTLATDGATHVNIDSLLRPVHSKYERSGEIMQTILLMLPYFRPFKITRRSLQTLFHHFPYFSFVIRSFLKIFLHPVFSGQTISVPDFRVCSALCSYHLWFSTSVLEQHEQMNIRTSLTLNQGLNPGTPLMERALSTRNYGCNMYLCKMPAADMSLPLYFLQYPHCLKLSEVLFSSHLKQDMDQTSQHISTAPFFGL